MNVFFFVLSATAFVASIAAALFAVRTARQLRELPVRELRSIASQIESMKTSLADTQQALELVANRVKMQRVRAAAIHADSSTNEPDPYKNPNEWRTMMNQKLAAAKVKG